MISVDDILKILDRIPAWKSLTRLPSRVDALEKRVADLEAQLGEPTLAFASEFVEYEGALFKCNASGTWQKSVYCPNCQRSPAFSPAP